MMSPDDYVYLDSEPFRGFIQTCEYEDEDGVMRVAYSGKTLRDPNLTVEEFMAKPENTHLKRITWAEFDQLNAAYIRKTFLDPMPQQISEREYVRMLEVLPPNDWLLTPGFQRFNLSEHTSGNITNQYARLQQPDGSWVCLTRYVDDTDPATWLTPASFNRPYQPLAARDEVE
jgi:hypothetical protein